MPEASLKADLVCKNETLVELTTLLVVCCCFFKDEVE